MEPPRKKFKLKIKPREPDLISELHDDMLHHILSFLNNKDAVQKAVISKRWNSVWANCPRLDFLEWRSGNNEGDGDALIEEADLFLDILHRRLVIQHVGLETNVTHFSLGADDDECDPLRVEQCVAALAYHRLAQVNLELVSAEPWLVSFLFRSDTLTQLRLQFRFSTVVQFPGDASLPNLEVLDITRLSFPDVALTERLISTSPHLRVLVMTKCTWLGWDVDNRIRISSPHLETLVFDTPRRDDLTTSGIMIHAPSLVCLGYRGDAADAYDLSNFGSLNRAYVHLRAMDVVPSDSKCQQIWNLWRVLSNITALTISGPTLEALSYSARGVPKFPNLAILEVTSDFKPLAQEALLLLLLDAPNLSSMVLHQLPYLAAQDEEDSRVWVQQRATDHQFALLKSFTFNNLYGDQNDLDMLKLILSNSPILQDMILAFPPELESDPMSQLDVTKKISEFRRSSALCAVRYES